ncbi:MAG TPA: N-acetylmuramoyl-L-alanine amidase [Longimicrobium sp.]|jgi:N-acetylmuramoyl-L-alanine amidase
MKIVNHRLVRDDGTPYPFVKTPNMGGRVEHRYLVIHYTAGGSAKESIDFLATKAAGASAHIVIGRDGAITQMVPFDRVAWHAGASRWEGVKGLNSHSLGIELDNAGKLKKTGGKWRAWYGGVIPDDEVLEAVHKNEMEEGIVRGWQEYTPKLIAAALQLSALLVRHYGLKDVIGHDDIAPGRKDDPGPAFPMESFRSRAMGRQDDQSPEFEVTAELNIRQGPGSQHPLIAGGPLPTGTRVEVLEERGSWRRVDVLGTVNGVMDLQGWVSSRFLVRAPAGKIPVPGEIVSDKVPA